MNTFSVLLHLFIHPKHKQISPVKPFLAGGGHWSLAEDAVVVPPWKSFLPSSPVLRGMCGCCWGHAPHWPESPSHVA